MACSSSILSYTPYARVGENIDQNLDCIYYINTNLLISFIDESRKIKAATRTSSYRWKGEQTFIIYVSYLYVTRYGTIWFLIEHLKSYLTQPHELA